MDVKLFKCEFVLADAFIVIDQQPHSTSGGVPEVRNLASSRLLWERPILRTLLIVKAYEIFLFSFLHDIQWVGA